MVSAFTRLLLATEHTEFDSGAESLAFALAQRCGLPLAAVLPIVSNAEFEAVAPQLAARADAEAATRREQVEALAARHGIALDLEVRRGSEPFSEIVDAARERHADLLVIRRRGKRGLLANLLVGEMVSKVVAHAPCSVLVTPRGATLWSRQVLVGVDPQSPAPEMLAQAAEIATECGIGLRLLCVAANEPARTAAAQAMEAALLHARARCPGADGEVRVGRPHQALMDAAAAAGADLIVIGRHGVDTLGRAWIGGTAQKVIGLAECPVLVHVKARGETLGHYFAFLKECGKHLDPKTRNLISVITKVDSQTERGFRQYLGRALREGCTPAEVLDALLMAFPTLGLAKIVWAVDIILAMDLPEFQPGAMGSAGAEWHDVMATKGVVVGSTQRIECDGRGLFVHRLSTKEWQVYDSRCPHQTTNIPHLALEGCTLTCPKHQWQFDIRSGACTAKGNSPLKQWPSKVVKGRLLAQW